MVHRAEQKAGEEDPAVQPIQWKLNVLMARAPEVNLSLVEVNRLVGQGTDSPARLAFAACPPGHSPLEAQVETFFPATIPRSALEATHF